MEEIKIKEKVKYFSQTTWYNDLNAELLFRKVFPLEERMSEFSLSPIPFFPNVWEGK
jgi:hypothetical protein